MGPLTTRRLTQALLALALLGVVGCTDDADPQAQATRDDCRRACSDVNFVDPTCIDAPTLAACQEACLLETTGTAQQFTDCVRSKFGNDSCEEATCLSILGVSTDDGDPTATARATCKANCDHIATDCTDETDAGVTAQCKAACDEATTDTMASFDACTTSNRYICSDLLLCYDHVGVIL